MGFVQKPLKIVQRSVALVDAGVVGDVVAVVPQRRMEKRQEPDRRDAQIADVVELFGQARKIADAVPVGVAIGPDMQLINHRILEPERIPRCNRFNGGGLSFHHPRCHGKTFLSSRG